MVVGFGFWVFGVRGLSVYGMQVVGLLNMSSENGCAQGLCEDRPITYNLKPITT